jgi:hypothetical protein
MSLSGARAGSGSPAASSIRSDGQRGAGAGAGGAGGGKKEQNEAYFAKLGSDNASRSDNLPPSQGGKFTGFGGGMPAPSASEKRSSTFGGFGGWGGGGGQFEDLQKDPMGTLTKGFGWFTSTVGKGAKQVNDSYLQPTAKQVCVVLLVVAVVSGLVSFDIQNDLRVGFSWLNPTLRLKRVFTPRPWVRICRLECAVRLISSTSSSKGTMDEVNTNALAWNLNAEISGMIFRL